jgi:alpha-glucosidase
MEDDFDEPRWPTFVLSNHDQPRHRTRYGSEARARAAAVLALTVRGTPFLYAGEELGLENAVVGDDRVVDPDGRDGCRAPIPWTTDGDAETGHGWPVRPWLPFPANASTHAAAAQVGVAGSMHSLYRRLLRLRHDHDVLQSGAIEFSPLDDHVMRYDRHLGDDHVVVLVNFREHSTPWPASVVGGTLLLSTDDSRADTGGELGPDEAVVVLIG